jgi:hypothetical protein
VNQIKYDPDTLFRHVESRDERLVPEYCYFRRYIIKTRNKDTTYEGSVKASDEIIAITTMGDGYNELLKNTFFSY